MRALDFWTDLKNGGVSFTLLKSDSTTGALSAIFKTLGTNKGNTCGEASFLYSYR